MTRRNWRCNVLLTAAVLLIVAGSDNGFSQTQDAGPLVLDAKIPLGKVAGRIDHMAIDRARHRLFVAELGNNSVGVVDLNAKTMVHRISGLREPQGVAYLQRTDSLYVANGGDGSLRIFQGSGYTPSARIALGSDADNIRFDAANDRLLVGYGRGALAVIDPAAVRQVATFALKAHPESFQLEAKTNRIFVNLPDARAIAVLELATGKELARWPMRYAANFAMTLDSDKGRLLVMFRRPAKLAAISVTTGALLQEADGCGDSDDLFLDPKRRRIYISCGEGFVEVFDAQGDRLRRLAHVATAEGARTSFFASELDRLYVAIRARPRSPTAIWVYRAGG
jgi:DNA-binding beta-propeller fold protein YncE